MKKYYVNKIIKNGILFCKNIKEIKKVNTYYDYDLKMLFEEYLMINNSFKINDIIKLTIETENDIDIYQYKIVKKDKDVLILAEYYYDYCKIESKYVAFDRGVKSINAIKELKISL